MGFKRMHKDGLPHAGIVIAPVGEEWNQEIVRVCLKLASEVQG